MTRISEKEIILALLAALSAPALSAQESPEEASEASHLRLQGVTQGHGTWGSLSESDRLSPKYVIAAICHGDPRQQKMVLQEAADFIFMTPEFIKALPEVIKALPLGLIPNLPLNNLGSNSLPTDTLKKLSDCRDRLLISDVNHPALSTLIKITREDWNPDYDLRSKLLASAVDIQTLPLIHAELSRYPDVQLHVRDILNRELFDQQIDGEPRTLPNSFITYWHRSVPEVLRFHTLSQDAGGMFNIVRELQSDYYYWNCGALDEALFLINKNLPAQMLQAAGQSKALLEQLGIFGVRRFDNAAEVILNRYQLLSSDQQRKLEKQFGDNPILLSSLRYSGSSASEVDRLKYLDSRPYALIVAVRPAVDHNGVFDFIHARGPNRDYIDRLSVAYKVLYFEVNGTEEFIDTLKYVAQKLPEKIELFLPMAHGYGSEMIWGELWSGG